MKKIIFALVLVFAGMAGFGLDTFHSDDDICEVYRGKEAAVFYIGHSDTRENVRSKVDEFLSKECGFLELTETEYVEKPYKNELTSAYKLVERYYEPEKDEIYIVLTDMSDVIRLVFFWINEGGKFIYWVYKMSW